MGAKLVIVDGLAELAKLESQAGDVKYKLFVPRGTIRMGRPTRIWSTKDGTNMVIIGTADLVALTKLIPGEQVPDGAVTTTYFKL
jgi:hypothetical protein